MAQIPILMNVIKKQLKLQGKTYSDVASVLGLSEASIKRLFVEHHFTLQRLELIAQLLGYELSELMLLVEKKQQLTELSLEQENEIASDVTLLLVTVCVMNGYRFADIVEEFMIDELMCIQKLAQLDRLSIIDLLPANRIKLLVSPNFKWLSRGPIQQFFQQKIQQDFFNSNFDKETEKLNVMNGMLRIDSIKIIQKKMQRLVEDFNNLIKEDKKIALQDKVGVTMVLAKRHWGYSIFESYRKEGR